MNFFYYGDYSDPIEGDKGKEGPLSALELHAELYALGDKYQVPGLSRLAIQKYEGRLKRAWDPQKFLQLIARVYNLTLESNRDLRNAALCHARSHVGKLQSDDAMRTQFRGTCLDIPEFTADLLQLYLHVPIRGDFFQCGSDQPVEPIQLRCLKCGKGGAR